MRSNRLISSTCLLALLTFSLTTQWVQANERNRLFGSAAPAAYRIQHSQYILYVSPVAGEEMVHLMLTPDWQKGIVNAPTLLFRGRCAPAGAVHISTDSVDSPDYRAFEASAKIDDFPYQNPLDIVRKELSFQCPDMVNITVLTSGDRLHENLKGWQASLRVENDWRLEAHNPTIASSEPVSVSFRSHKAGARTQRIEYNVGADYEGLCKDEVAVTLSVFPSPDNGNGTPSMANYEWASGGFTSALRQYCPQLEKINYTMDPVAWDYNCLEACDVYASVDSGWSFESGDLIDYSQSATSEFAISYADILAVLADDENRRVLPLHSVSFRSFYHRYLGHYSGECRAYLKDPVPFQYSITTTTSDGYGTELYSDTETLDGITYVERAYAEKFGQYYKASKGKALGDLFGSVIGNLGSGRAPSPNEMAYSLMQEDQVIIEHLKQGCSSESVKRVYANLYEQTHPK